MENRDADVCAECGITADGTGDYSDENLKAWENS